MMEALGNNKIEVGGDTRVKHQASVDHAEKCKNDDDDEGFILPSAEEEAKIIKKLDRRILPVIFALYSLSVLDRSNLGNAKLAGLTTSIDLGGHHYQWLGNIFYISYILSQWTLMGWKQFPPHVWAAFVVMAWGIIASVQASVTSWQGLMACRFFLGVAEAAFGPGVALYLSFFYPRNRLGFRQGAFISGAAFANAYGGALAYAISHIHGKIAPWQILFLIEGLPTCALAFATWFLLPDNIDGCHFLEDREKDIAKYFVNQNQRLDVGKATGLRVGEAFRSLLDYRSFIPALMYFGINVSFASLPLFLPTIISEIGTFSAIQANGLSAPPYLLCTFTIILCSWISDKIRMRGLVSGLAAFIAAIGFLMLAVTSGTVPRYFATFLAVNIFVSVAITLAWVSNLHSTESKRAGGYTILATFGQCGPVLGTNIFPESDAPFYRKGMWISFSFCMFVAGLCALLSFLNTMANRRIDKENSELDDGPEDVPIAHRKYHYVI